MNAGPLSRRVAGDLISKLQDIAEPYILQRSMQEHFKVHLPPKKEFVVWIKPSAAQWEATKQIIDSESTEFAKASGNRFCIFSVIQRLRMVALHPFFADQVTDDDVKSFLDQRQNHDATEDEDVDVDELLAKLESNSEDGDQLSSYLAQNRPSDIMRDSTILRVCKDLLDGLVANGHKVLVFCPYRKPIDFLGYVLEHSKIRFYRIDGQISQKNRNQYIKSFNETSFSCRGGESSSTNVMLLTIGAGGLGLTLTGADRVILLGASWNPMVDAQAVGRAFRIGQERPIKVYRLLMANLIDEKV